MTEKLPSQELDRIAHVIADGVYPGYPAPADRLYIDTLGLDLSGETPHVPEGPWFVSGHSNRTKVAPDKIDPEVDESTGPLPASVTERWERQGLQTDQLGRPINPHAEQLLADPRIGLPTGIGFFWRYGANGTVDGVLHRNRSDEPDRAEVLLIRRKIGRKWALPGGFIDPTDDSYEAAARREIGEETNLWDLGGTGTEIYHKRAVGQRDTLHAWTANVVLRIDADQDELYQRTPVPYDDVEDTGWFRLERADEMLDFDAHRIYLDVARRSLRERPTTGV